MKQTRLLQNISTVLHEQTGSTDQQTSITMILITALKNQSQLLESISSSLEKLTKSSPFTARDCTDIATQGPYANGPYTISPWDEQGSFKVYCDIESEDAGEGWTVLQRRFDGSVDFNRGWEDYKNGFGNLDGEFWLGLSKIFRLVRSGGPWELKVELEDFDGNKVYARYGNFSIGDESTEFQLMSVGEFEGSVADGLTYHVNRAFSTKDRDNDASGGNCAANGAWWHGSCYNSNLNGRYRASEQNTHNGIVWEVWKSRTTLKAAEMKIRLIR